MNPLEKLNKDLEPYGLAIQLTQARFTGGSYWQISLEGTAYAVHACDDAREALLYWLSLPSDNPSTIDGTTAPTFMQIMQDRWDEELKERGTSFAQVLEDILAEWPESE